MKRLLPLSLACLFALPCRALTPVSEPLPDSFARFEALYPKRADELVKAIRSRLPQTKHEKIGERLEHIDRYLGNLKSMDIPDVRRELKNPKNSKTLPLGLSRLCTDLLGLRKSIDALLIEASAAKVLVLDEPFLVRLREFWDDEYYFTWRFHSEAIERLAN